VGELYGQKCISDAMFEDALM